MSVLELAWRRYLHQLDANPLKTKALTSGVLAACADICAQKLTSGRSQLNWRRTAAIGLYGLLWGGPSNHLWQRILEWLVPAPRRGAPPDTLRPVKKVVVDQLTYGPLNNCLFMLFIAVVVEGQSWRWAQRKVASDYPAVQSRGWRVWPVAQFVNQTFVPLELRVLFTNVVAFAWSTFLIVRSKTAAPLLSKQQGR